jgi:GT2 family glycosyltransferase
MDLLASIVVPNLDSPLVDRTLRALSEQTLEPRSLEVLIVGRDTPGLVPGDGSVRLLESVRPLGPGAARNLGVREARADTILFTDADCRPDPQWAELLVAALDRAPVAGGGVRFALTGNRWAVADNIASFHELLADRPASRSADQAVGSLNMGVRRAAWEAVGPFDESLITSEDYDWILRARALGQSVLFEPSAVVEHADVRADRAALEAHAAWYGRHFRAFCRKHPGVFDSGPTWRSRRRLLLTYRLKSWIGALRIFLEHPQVRPAWRTLPAVATFRRTWYQTILADWQES